MCLCYSSQMTALGPGLVGFAVTMCSLLLAGPVTAMAQALVDLATNRQPPV